MEHSAFAKQLFTLIGATTLVATVFHYLKLPTIVGFIAAGMIIGPYGFGVVASVPGAEFMSEIGIIFLMFTIGLEFSLSRLRSFKKTLFGLGFTQILGTILVTALIFYFMAEVSVQKAIFFGFLLSLSSTAIVVKLLQDSRETGSPYGNAIIGVLLAQDLAVIPMMLLLPLLATTKKLSTEFSYSHFAEWATRFGVVIVLVIICARYVVPFLLERVAKTRSHELFFSSILLLCFGVAFAMDTVGLSLSFGAFLAGMMIAESPYGRQATADIMPMRDNFLGLFFASVGMLVDPAFVVMKFHWIFLIVLSILIIKSGIVYSMARFLNYTKTIAVIAGLMVFQIGEFSFILANTGKSLGLIDQPELQAFLSVSVITMMLTPFIYKMAPRFAFSQGFEQLARFDFIDVPKGIMRIISDGVRHKPKGPSAVSVFKKQTAEQGAHTIIIGFGVAGQNLAISLKTMSIPYTIIEQNLDLVQKFKAKGDPVFFGDASRAEILEHAGIANAKLVVIAVSGIQMTGAIVEAVRKERPDVNIIIRTQYSREAEQYANLENTDVVVAEYETTIELLGRALLSYGVSGDDIHSLMAQTRKNLRGSVTALSDFLRRKVDIPAWETIGSIKPLLIKSDYTCIGRSIAELALRAMTGVTIVAIYREGLGTSIPTGEFVLAEGDVLHVVGDGDSFAKAKTLLAGREDVTGMSRLSTT